MNNLENKWHTTSREKPAADTVVIGYWVGSDDTVFVGLCYLDDLGDWYLAEDGPGMKVTYRPPKYWIEDPIKR